MKLLPQRRSADPDHRAREWFVRLLDEDVSRTDLEAWQAWLEEDPAHRDAYQRIVEVWSAAGAATTPRPAQSELAADDYDPQVPVAVWRRRRQGGRSPRLVWVSAAAALVAVVAWLGLSEMSWSPAKSFQLQTQRGQELQTRLDDGSTLALGGLTRLEVRYSRKARRVHLIGGEAFFTVASDRRRPFVVDTPLGAMTAIGTAFDIDVNQKMVTLQVTKGKVAVRTQPGRGRDGPPDMSVVAGERLQIARSTRGVSVLKEPAAMPPSWQEGRLAYRAEPLERVLEDVNRYAPRPIVLADQELGKLSYTGTVRLDDIDAWTRGLPAVFPVAVDAKPEVVRLKKR